MRLPWPFGRSEGARAETEPTSDGPTLPSLSEARGPAPDAPPTGAWAGLPPIQRVSGEPPVVASARTFLAEVPGARPLPPIVGALGHDVTPLAPAGLVAAPVHAVDSLTSHASLVDRPVQRRTAETDAGALSAPVTVDSGPVAAPAGASLGGPASGEGGAVSPAAAPTAPSRQLPVVAPGSGAEAPTRSLTSAAIAAPRPVDRPAARRTNVQTSPDDTTASSSATAPAAPGAPQATTRAAGPSTTPLLPSGSPDAAVPSSSPAGPRRPGLGAPLRGAHPPTLQRTPAAGPVLTGAPRSPAVGPPGAAPIAGSRPIFATVQRRGQGARSVSPADADDALLPVPERPGSPQAPYVGRPLAAGFPQLPVVSRSAAGGGPDEGGGRGHWHDVEAATGGSRVAPSSPAASAGAGAASMPVARSQANRPTSPAAAAAHAAPVQRQTAAPSTRANEPRPLVGARSLRPSVGPAALPADDATVQRSAPDGAASTAVPAAGSGGGSSSTFLDAAPSLFATMPASAPAAASPRTVQTSRHDAPSMTLARPPTPAPAAPATTTIHFPAASGGAGGSILGGSIVGPAASGAFGPIVQATPGGPFGASGQASGPVVQRIDGSAPPPPDDGGGQSEGELEELAKALFPRFQRQLRMEYVHEREARGLPFDI